MEMSKLKELLNECWSIETCAPALINEWSKENPSLGQCAVTSLIVNDYFGGRLMRCMTSSGSHYYNLIDDIIVDLTSQQFLGIIPKYEEGEERTREYLLSNENTKRRYLLLKYSLLKMIKDDDLALENTFSLKDYNMKLYVTKKRKKYKKNKI